jgi:hypothetical protein
MNQALKNASMVLMVSVKALECIEHRLNDRLPSIHSPVQPVGGGSSNSPMVSEG